jgi:hypothetical protein
MVIERKRAVEEIEGSREDRGPYRRQRAIEGIGAEEETEGSRQDRGLLRKQRVIEGHREDKGP